MVKEKINYPKVLIVTPTYEGKGYILDRFIDRVKEFTYPNCEFIMFDNSKTNDYFERIKVRGVNVMKCPHYIDTRENICTTRNIIVDYFLKSDCEYMFHLEQDVIPQENIIEKLVKWKKLVIGGYYYINQGRTLKRICVFKGFIPIDGPNDYKGKMMALMPYSYDIMGKDRLMKIYLGSLGVTLIHRDIFEKHKIKFWWAPELTWHDDTGFFHDLDIRGIEVFIDTDLLVPHFQSSWAVDNFEEKNRQELAKQMEGDIHG